MRGFFTFRCPNFCKKNAAGVLSIDFEGLGGGRSRGGAGGGCCAGVRGWSGAEVGGGGVQVG